MKKCLLIFLLHAHAFGAFGDCSSAFAGRLATFAQSKWNPVNWFKDPVISCDYSKADFEQNPQSQKIVFRSQSQELIVIDEGHVFKKSKTTNFEWRYIEDTSSVQAILLYKNSLIALRTDGDIFILSEEEEKTYGWLKIGNSASKILSTDQDLFALVKNRLWIYKGAPEEDTITFSMVPVYIGSINDTPTTTLIMVPQSGGRKVAFEKSPVKDLADISLDLENQDLKLTFKNGTTALYYRDLQGEGKG